MTDKERILLCLVNRLYIKSLYGTGDRQKWLEMQPGLHQRNNSLCPGDLVTTATTIAPNAFMVGYVQEVCSDHVVIREIGSEQACNYYNEHFHKIDKDLLGYEILEGVQYKTYGKVLKAFEKSKRSYSIRFQSIEFYEKMCTVKGRKVFSDETVYTIAFEYKAKTSIKSIVDLLDKAADGIETVRKTEEVEE